MKRVNLGLIGVCLLVSVSSAHAEDRLRGTVAAPPGYDVHGTILYSCDLSHGPECASHEYMREFNLADEHGQNHRFSLVGLERKKPGYGLTAWKDMNKNTKVDQGDLIGVYFKEGDKITPITVPADNIFIQMVVAGKDQSPPAPPYNMPTEVSSADPFSNPLTLANSWSPPSPPLQTLAPEPSAEKPAAPQPQNSPSSPGNVTNLTGRWSSEGNFKEVEFGPSVAMSNFGLPAGQRLGTIGNPSKVGSYDWGVRHEYKPVEVTRDGSLSLESNGAFNWHAIGHAKKSSTCTRTTEFTMKGQSSFENNKLTLKISQGEEKISYNSECTKDPAKVENLAGRTRVYETKMEGDTLKIRQIEPKISNSSFLIYKKS